MTDKNGAVLHTGDIVRVENAYFKTDNSLYFVETFDAENAVNIWLKKVGKTGKVLDGVNQWPLCSYCSDSRKNAARKFRFGNTAPGRKPMTEKKTQTQTATAGAAS